MEGLSDDLLAPRETRLDMSSLPSQADENVRSPCLHSTSNILFAHSSGTATSSRMTSNDEKLPPLLPASSTSRKRREAMESFGPPESSNKKSRADDGAEKKAASPSPRRLPVAAEDDKGDVGDNGEVVVADALAPRRIVETAEALFGTSKGVSSRIFGSFELFTMARSESRSNDDVGDHRSSSAGALTEAAAKPPFLQRKDLERVFRVLEALVKHEGDCLADADHDPYQQDDVPAPASKAAAVRTGTRRVAFCSTDGSVAHPPIGRIEGSSVHRAKALDSLLTVLRRLAELSPSDIPVLRQLASFLRQDNDDAAAAIARSISPNYPVKDIRKLIQMYREDFSRTEERLVSDRVSPLPPLHVEQRALTWLGQFIRFLLRSLLNKAPPRLSRNDTRYEERCEAYSRVTELVNLVSDLPESDQSSVVDEEDFAVLVRNALETVNGFLGDAVLLPTFPAGDAGHAVAPLWSRSLREELQDPNWGEEPTPDLIASLKTHIVESARFLACRGAAHFLVDLFSSGAVQAEMKRRGGIEQVESYAIAMLDYDLYVRDEEGCHAPLVLLSNISSFVEQLSRWLDGTEDLANECWDAWVSLRSKVWKWKGKERSGMRGEIIALFKEQLAYAKSIPTVEEITTSIMLRVIVGGKLFKSMEWM